MVKDAKITYFSRPGRENTPGVIECVARRLGEGGVAHVVVASNSGATAAAFLGEIGGNDVELVSVTEHAGYAGGDATPLKEEYASRLKEAGVPILVCSHARPLESVPNERLVRSAISA